MKLNKYCNSQILSHRRHEIYQLQGCSHKEQLLREIYVQWQIEAEKEKEFL
jgi:hypothetical protein